MNTRIRFGITVTGITVMALALSPNAPPSQFNGLKSYPW
jgi:hypothetical protein